jgi:hypothetical protein
VKATIVSLVPWTIKETKPGMIPSEYEIPKSDGKTPSVLVISDAVTNIYMGADQGTFPVPVPVDKLAESIVSDSVKAVLEVDDISKPGMFWVENEHTAKDIIEKFPKELDAAKQRQNRWFMKLIRLADDMWARTHQHRAISDMQRVAAAQLGLASKEWAITPEPIQLVKCPACTTMIENTALVCKNCRAIINPEKAKAAGITFAA